MSSFDFCCCEKKQKSACMYDCDNGYIVEKVIGHDCDCYNYRGLLTMNDMSSDVCLPLYLRKIDVLNAEPIALSCAGQKLRLTLALQGTDSRNCIFQNSAYIELDTKPLNCEGFNRCKVNIRRDIQVRIQNAVYCHPCGFQVCLLISIESILSRYDIVYQQRECCKPKSNLPLYPPVNYSKGEHFGCCFK